MKNILLVTLAMVTCAWIADRLSAAAVRRVEDREAVSRWEGEGGSS